MEPISLAVGMAATKWALKMWAVDSIAVDFGSELVSAFSPKLLPLGRARSAGRQFERIAEAVAGRMEPAVVGRGFDESEVATNAALRALGKIDLAAETLISFNLDSQALASHIKAHDSGDLASEQLSEDSVAVYGAIIDEACSYAVGIASSMPDFTTAFASTVLDNDHELYAIAETTLRQIPTSSVPSTWGKGSDYERFEGKYKRLLFEKANRLQLLGATSAARSQYALNVAYIPLQVTYNVLDKLDEDEPASHSLENRTSPAEEALAGSARVLIAGEAGSGKTTLVQWITIQAAQSSFTGGLESWNGLVPFVIQLRQFGNGTLPSPEEFVRASLPVIAGAMPSGWVHALLEDGRAVVLIDGFDEVASERRQETLDWLGALIASFPSSKYVVTSRHTAVESSWRGPEGFRHVKLLPMEMADIREFVAHWHEAAASAPNATLDAREIDEARRGILLGIRDKPQLRALCTSPLLCALVCSMNMEGGSRLPDNRMELYDTALKMLVSQRDKARKIKDHAPVKLDFHQTNTLLRNYAHWVHDNGRSDSTHSEYLAQLSLTLERLPKVKGTASVVGTYLIDRSGVLRQPVEGRVDFIHRTFLEYLAASAVAKSHDVRKMLKLATDDHWREVIIMAAGHFAPDEQEALMRGLILRGKKEPGKRHLLFLLAVSCMETVTELDAELGKELQACLAEVMPPSNMTAAAAVATAGNMGVPMLARPPAYATDAAACVRALSLIGGEAAQSAIRNYAPDGRVTVARQVIRAWSYFDAEPYAREVLSASPLDGGDLTLTDPELAPFLHLLPKLKNADLDLGGRLSDPSILTPHPAVRRLDAHGARQVENLRWLRGYNGLKELGLMNSSLESLRGIEHAPKLEGLDVDGSKRLTDLEQLASVSSLRRLDVASTGVYSLPEFSHPLDHLRMMDMQNLRSYGTNFNAVDVHLSGSDQFIDISGIQTSDTLKHARISGYVPKRHYPDAWPDGLSSLSISLFNNSVQPPSGARGLKSLSLRMREVDEAWLEFIFSAPSLETLELGPSSFGAQQPWIIDLGAHPNLRVIVATHVAPGTEPIVIPGFAYTQSDYFVHYLRDE